MGETKRHARRDFFGFAAVAVSGLIAAPAFAAPVIPTKRSLSFHDLNTNESLSVDYFQNGRYLPDAAGRIAHVLRDYRADEAHAMGLVNRLASAADIEQVVGELAQTMAANAPLTIRATKEMIRRLLAQRRLTQGADRDLVEMCYTSADFREGVTAFLAKRAPKWTGA